MAGEDPHDRVDPMARLFPKMTKCTIHTFGPAGTVQIHDALCVLPLNVVNEKIFVVLWFWLVFLAGIGCLAIIYRYVSPAGIGAFGTYGAGDNRDVTHSGLQCPRGQRKSNYLKKLSLFYVCITLEIFSCRESFVINAILCASFLCILNCILNFINNVSFYANKNRSEN